MIGTPKKGMIWQMSKTKQRKSTAGKSIAIFFIVFIILEGLIIFGLKTIFKNEDSVPSLGNYSFFLMDSYKMSPRVPKDTLVIAVNGTPSADKLRNAVLCRTVGEEGTTVAWLYMIGSKGDTVNGVVYTVFQCQGDDPENETNANYIDVDSADVIGVATSHYMTAGKIVSFVITPFGMVICLAVPLIMLVLLELVVAITNRSEDDSYEPAYGNDPRFYNNNPRQQGQKGQQNGNTSLDDFLYGGNGDEVYGTGRPDEDYAEEFSDDRRAPANRQQRAPMQQRTGKPDFSVNDEPDFEEENDPFGDEEENSFADSVFGQPEQEAPAQFFKQPDEAPEAEPFADEDDFEEDEVFAEPAAPAQPAVDREYYEKAARMIEGDDYQPTPAPAPAPAPAPQLTKPVQQPAQPVMNLEKPAPARQQAAPARQPAPARAEQPARQTVPRRRPAQPPQGAPRRRRPVGAAPSRQGGAAPQRRPRPAQARPGQQRKPVPHKNANAALADLTAKMQAEQQKLGNNQ